MCAPGKILACWLLFDTEKQSARAEQEIKFIIVTATYQRQKKCSVMPTCGSWHLLCPQMRCCILLLFCQGASFISPSLTPLFSICSAAVHAFRQAEALLDTRSRQFLSRSLSINANVFAVNCLCLQPAYKCDCRTFVFNEPARHTLFMDVGLIT